ncbi:autotransporter assembly complex family protein [Acidocella sp. KAb 2-4]|uniref:autotransporter assembly complex protein TamA n=1 Tax=Acidocella sp. KAb 2-4 TaxID=2885158 RepID=UPI001D06E6A7|nr:BamA/TamA family outer membrane protein [Acidocella sp. KAb 2-4]MCB5945250.1 BamA/TamA family outer membrane protein [Acidocella sp. KAb 2-4]
MRRTILLPGAFLLLAAPALAADPVQYRVSFAPSGDAGLDVLLRQTSALVELARKLPPAPFALIGRARADARQFTIVLHSLGYDDGSVAITINGAPLSDPTLPDALTQAPASAVAEVRVVTQKGARFTLGQVNITGLPPGFTPPAMVKPGAPALAAPILAAQPALLSALHNAGYAFASVSAPLAIAHPPTHKLDVTYSATPGPRVAIGPIGFTGLKRTKPAFLRRHIALAPGQPYSDTALQQARDSLLGLGVFSSVSPLPPDPAAVQNGAVPVTFNVLEQKRHTVSLTGAYATDTGISLSTSWLDRNLFGQAETLTLSAAANDLGGTGTTSAGYDLKALFTKPDYYARGQTLSLNAEGLRQSLTAYSRTALLLGAALSRPVDAHGLISFGPSFVSERVNQEGQTRTYVLTQFPLSFTWSGANDLLEPTRGVNASLTLTPTYPVAGHSHPFLIALASASAYLPVEARGWGVLALRGQVGSIQGARQFQVPPDQRFYAGGSGTVRGYTYQTIGPLFPDDIPEGGAAMDAFSLEFRQHVTKTIGLVPFIDAGQVSAGSAPFTGTLRVGAGLGARYYTGIGPIRLDVAFPLTRTAGSGGFALYIGLGEAF